MSPWNKSYVYGYDNKSGWGGRYFFTYFNDFHNEVTPFIILQVFLCTIIFLISIASNIGIITCVFKFPDMRTVTNSFVLNLAAADILFALTIPAVALSRITPYWVLGNIACKVIPYIQFVSGIVLLWTLTLISMDRYRCIVVPPYRSKISTSQAILYSALMWIVTSIVCAPILLWFREQETDTSEFVCTLVFPKSEIINYSMCFIIIVVLIEILLPMAILVYNYYQIFKKILSTRGTWASSCVMVSTNNEKGCNQQLRRQSEVSLSDIFTPWPRKFSNGQTRSNSRHGSLSQHEEQRVNKHIKAVRVLFLNVVVVLLMWLPITLVMLLIFIDGRRDSEDQSFFLRSEHFIVALIIAFLNTLINPLLYGVLSDNFRACMVRLWCLKSTNNNENTTTPSTFKNIGSVKLNRKASAGHSGSENQFDVV